jgi:hypothetical protein
MPWIEKILEKYNSEIEDNMKELIIQKGIFNNKVTKVPHWHTFGILKDDKKIPYITDQKTSIEKNNYELKPILKNIYLKKKSILLEVDKDEIILIGNKKELVVQPFVKSAHSYGFDEKIMKDEFLSKEIFLYSLSLN